MNRYYLYCITESGNDASLGRSGIGGAEVQGFSVGKYMVLNSCFDSDFVGKELKNLKTHNYISLQAMEKGTVLPFSFGTIVRNLEDIGVILKNKEACLEEHFFRLQDKVETGIKVFGTIDMKNLEADRCTSPGIIRLDQVKNRTAPVNYLVKKVKDAYDYRKREEYLSDQSEIIFPAFDFFVEERKINIGKNDGLLLNAAFLIHKNNLAEFKRLFIEIKSVHPRYSFVFSGPWPPYSFIELTASSS